MALLRAASLLSGSRSRLNGSYLRVALGSKDYQRTGGLTAHEATCKLLQEQAFED